MKKQLFLLMLVAAFGQVFGQSPITYPAYNPDDISVPFQKFTLSNGLTLLVAEDHKAPIAAVNIWYHVGSKNEKPGKSGFAHLFEHLMFNGSEHYNTDYFKIMENIGATDLNGTTNNDRTNFFQNIPINALDQVLWLESDRMGHLKPAVDQAKLDEQRGVVQNEKRQGENQAYARGWDMVEKNLFPKGHPYSWTVIGEMEDLNAASLADVHEWFDAYYGAGNAVICIAGDITPAEALEKTKKYFGDIPGGPTVTRPERNLPKRTGETRSSYQDHVPQTRILMTWIAPEWGSEESVSMDLASDILGTGKNSRLFKKLVYEKQIATTAACFYDPREIAGVFYVMVDVKAGVSAAEVEAATNEVLAEFLEKGPTEDEVNRVRAAVFANFIKGLERIGGFGGKSDQLCQNMVYGGDPEFYKTTMKRWNAVTAAMIFRATNKYLADGKDVIICTPAPEFKTETTGADRSKLPELATPVAAKFPDLQRATLSNGMKIVLAQRTGSPSIVMQMLMDGGFSADKLMKNGKLGLATLTMDMMAEGTKTLNSLQIAERMQILGAGFGTGADLDYCTANLNALKQSLDPALDIWADVILNPAFPEKELARLKDEMIAGIAQEKADAGDIIQRVMPELLYGKDHPYAVPFTGSGTSESVQTIGREDVENFYKTWIRPNNATLVVTGDISMADLTAKLEKRFSGWKKGDVPKKVIPNVAADATKGTIFLIDRPESEQSQIAAGYLVDKYGTADENAIEQLNNVFGGDFTSRVNMNLREDKHWSYGAGTFLRNTKGQRPYIVFAGVQTDKTKESVTEVMKEFELFTTTKPITDEEFKKTQANTIMGLPGMWETNRRVNASLAEIVRNDLKDNHWKNYDQAVRNLTLSGVQSTAAKIIRPKDLSWFVVGDAAKVQAGLEASGLKVVVLDANGKPVVKGPAKLKP